LGSVGRLAAAERPIPCHPNLVIGDSPAGAVGVHEHHPHQRAFWTVVDHKVRPSRSFRSFQVKGRIELCDQCGLDSVENLFGDPLVPLQPSAVVPVVL